MKKIILSSLLIFSFSFNVYAASKKDRKDEAIKNLLSTIEVYEFSEQVKKIKKYNTIDDVDEKNYKMKKFFSNKKLWHYFDHENFVKGLEAKIKKNFTEEEIVKLDKFLKQPFILKVLNASILHRDLFQFNKDSFSEIYSAPELQQSRYILMNNLFKLHGMDIQKENLEKKLSVMVKSGKVMMNVLSKKSSNKILVDPKKLENRLKNSKDFIIKHFSNELISFRHYEIRDYFRRCRKSKTSQKFIQLYANYHFLYMMKYIDKVEQDKLDELKALKVVQ